MSIEPTEEQLAGALSLYGLGPAGQPQKIPFPQGPTTFVPQGKVNLSPTQLSAIALSRYVSDRYNNIHPNLAQNQPYVAMGLASSNMPAPHLKLVTAGLSSNWGWLSAGTRSLDSVNGQAAVRWNSLSAQEQQFVLSGGNGTDPQPITLDQYEKDVGKENAKFLGLIPEGPPQLNFPAEVLTKAENGDPQAQAYLYVMNKLYPQSVWHWHGIKPGWFNQNIGEALSQQARQIAIAGDMLFSPITGGISYAGDVFWHEANKGTPYEQPLPSPLTVWKQAAFPELRGSGAGTSWGLAGMDLFGFSPTDPGVAQAVAATSFISNWYLSPDIMLANAARGFKVANETFTMYRDLRNAAEFARGAGEVDRAAFLDSEAATIRRGVSHSLITQRAFDIFAKTPEEILGTGKGLRTAQELIDKVNAGATAESLQRTYRGLGPITAGALERLKGGSVEDVVNVLANHVRGVTGSYAKDIRNALGDISRLLDQGQPQDVADQLLARKHVLQATLDAKVSPEFAPLRQLPETSFLWRVTHEAAQNPGEQVLATVFSGHPAVPVFFSRIDNTEKLAAADAEWQRLTKMADDYAKSLPEGVTGGLESSRLAGRLDKLKAEIQRLSAEDGQRTLVTTRKTRFSLDSLWSDIYKRKVYIHTDPNEMNPPDALAHNLKQFERFMKMAGVDVGERNLILGSFREAATNEDFFQALGDMMRSVGNTQLVRAGKRALAPGFVDDLDTWARTVEDMRHTGLLPRVVDTQGIGRELRYLPTLPGLDAQGRVISLVDGPEAMISHVLLPPVENMIDSTSLSRRVFRELYSKGPLGKAAWHTYRGAKWSAQAATALWRDLILLPRAVFALPLRILGEQNVRAWAFDQASAINAPEEWWRYVKTRDDLPVWWSNEFVGSIYNDISEQAQQVGTKVRFRASGRDGRPEPGFEQAWAGRLGMLSKDELAKELARSSPDAAFTWLMGPDGFRYRRAMEGPVTEHLKWLRDPIGGARPEATLEDAWRSHLDLKQQELDFVTNGHPRILEGIASGDYKNLSPALEAEIVAERHALQARYEELTNQYHDAPTPQESLLAAHDQRQVKEQIDEITKELEGTPTIPIGGDEMASELARMIQDEEIKPPDLVSGYAFERLPRRVRQPVRNWMYEHLLANRDLKYSRLPLMRSIRDQEFARLKSFGWGDAQAFEQASVYGARRAADILYDLSTRTSAQRFFRTISPFAPAWQELLETYAWKIPSQFYPGIGHAYLLERGKQVQDLFKGLKIDLSSAMKIPFAGQILGFLTGGNVSPEAEFYPYSLNFVTSNGLSPGLGPIAAVTLNEVAKHSKVVDAIAAKLEPYSPSFSPYVINRVAEAITGGPNPLELLSPKAQRVDWQFALDTATNEVFMQERKNAPNPKDFSQDDVGIYAYRQALQSWIDGVNLKAERRARVWSLFEGISSMFWPAPVHLSDEVRDEYTKMYQSIYQMAGVAQGSTVPADQQKLADFQASPEGQALYDKFLQQFPGADLYLTPTSIKRFPKSFLDGQSKDAKSYDKYFDGQRELLTSDQRLALGLYLQSLRAHQETVASITEAVGGQGTPDQVARNILFNYGTYKDRVNKAQFDFDTYGRYNQEGHDLFNTMLLASSNKPGRPNYTIQQNLLLNLLGLMNESKSFLSEGGLKPNGFSDFRRAINDTLTKMDTQFGKPKDPVALSIRNWFDNTYSPYLDKVGAIFDQIDKVPNAEKGVLYDQVRALANDQVSKNGFPTPEQFVWGNSTPQEQNIDKAKWSTRPLEWLTTFQLQQLGVNAPGTSDFLTLVNSGLEALKTWSSQNHVSPSSNLYQSKKQQLMDALGKRAQQSGLGPIWQLDRALPFERLTASGFASQWTSDPNVKLDPGFLKVANTARVLAQYIKAQGYTPGGSSKVASEIQQAFAVAVNELRKRDPLLNNDMDFLETSLAKSGSARRAEEDLYMFLFWGNTF